MKRALVRVSYSAIESVLTNSFKRNVSLYGLPEDAKLVEVQPMPDRQMLCCYFEHESFEEVPETSFLPVVEVKAKWEDWRGV